MNLGGPCLLVVNIIINYCCTVVHVHCLRENAIKRNWRNMGFLSHFYHWWHFDWGAGSHEVTPMRCVSNFHEIFRKAWFCKICYRIRNAMFHYYQTWCSLFGKKLPICTISNVMFNFKKLSFFSWYQESSKHRVANGTESYRLNIFCGIRE